MADDNDDQNNELTALASMYDESMFKMHKDSDQLYCGALTAQVEVAKPLLVKLHAHGNFFRELLVCLLCLIFEAYLLKLFLQQLTLWKFHHSL
jgi:hypothetical protein